MKTKNQFEAELEQLMKDAVDASVYRPASVVQEPHTRLTQWQVHRVTTVDGFSSIHFMGYAGYEGRVCSSVQTYDPTTKRGITKSGRIYELIRDPGVNRDAMYVFNNWCSRFPESTIFENITHQYI